MEFEWRYKVDYSAAGRNFLKYSIQKAQQRCTTRETGVKQYNVVREFNVKIVINPIYTYTRSV
jgi:hypothetical protein